MDFSAKNNASSDISVKESESQSNNRGNPTKCSKTLKQFVSFCKIPNSRFSTKVNKMEYMSASANIYKRKNCLPVLT